MSEEHHFLLQRVQPAMVGLIDGSLSTLPPIFGIAFYTHRPHTAFIAGLATSTRRACQSERRASSAERSRRRHTR